MSSLGVKIQLKDLWKLFSDTWLTGNLDCSERIFKIFKIQMTRLRASEMHTRKLGTPGKVYRNFGNLLTNAVHKLVANNSTLASPNGNLLCSLVKPKRQSENQQPPTKRLSHFFNFEQWWSDEWWRIFHLLAGLWSLLLLMVEAIIVSNSLSETLH